MTFCLTPRNDWQVRSCAQRMPQAFNILAWTLLFMTTPALSWAGSNNNSWKEFKSTHVVVYSRNASPAFINEVAASSENYYKSITAAFGFSRYKGWTWANRASVYIYDGKSDYVEASRLGWSAGSVDAASRQIRTFPSEHGFFDSVLPHELAHIVLKEFIGFSEKVPRWFDEGAAMWAEKARRFDADARVRQAMAEGSYMSIRELSAVALDTQTPKPVVDLFYTEAASLFSFLIDTLEPYRFERLCNELKNGKSFEHALAKADMRFKTLKDLERFWKEYVIHGKTR